MYPQIPITSNQIGGIVDFRSALPHFRFWQILPHAFSPYTPPVNKLVLLSGRLLDGVPILLSGALKKGRWPLLLSQNNLWEALCTIQLPYDLLWSICTVSTTTPTYPQHLRPTHQSHYQWAPWAVTRRTAYSTAFGCGYALAESHNLTTITTRGCRREFQLRFMQGSRAGCLLIDQDHL